MVIAMLKVVAVVATVVGTTVVVAVAEVVPGSSDGARGRRGEGWWRRRGRQWR